ncbi:MAG TPA: pyridoxal-dependent decarboxylase [Micromonosporaceae bacterium]
MNEHMTPEEFRRYGHAAVDWIADYWQEIERHPVLSQVAPGEIASRLPAAPPASGEPFDRILADLGPTVLPGITHWQHPSFFGYFPANISGPSVLADLACAGLGVQGMLWATSPACTELETVMMDWLVDLLDLPKRFRSDSTGGGVIQDTASSAALVATLTALHRVSGGGWGRAGVDRRYTLYASSQAHSSIEKAARIAGIGDDNVRLIDVDPDTLAMRPAALRARIAQDRAEGATPALVVATIGTTSTTAMDPVLRIGEVCREQGVWLHVDAAYAGAAATCPEFRWTHAGVEYADSYCFNPHKWLLTGFDCDAFWVADRGELIQTLSVLPEYLRNAATESGAVIDYRDWQVPLGRRMRALKLWFVMRWYGVEGLRRHVRHGVALAQEFAGWVASDERFEIVAPYPLSLVCFRLRAHAGEDEASADARNGELLRRLNGSGGVCLTHTRVHDRYVLRLAVGAPATERRHVLGAWNEIRRFAGQV